MMVMIATISSRKAEGKRGGGCDVVVHDDNDEECGAVPSLTQVAIRTANIPINLKRIDGKSLISKLTTGMCHERTTMTV